MFEDTKKLTFQIWRDDVELIVGKIDKDFKNILEEADKDVAEVTERNVKATHPEFNWELVKELHTHLEMTTVGESRSIVKTHGGEKRMVPKQGEHYMKGLSPSTIQTETAMMTKTSEIARKEIRDVKDAPSVVIELEDRVRSFSRSGGQTLLPKESMKGVIMTVLPSEVKAFMSQHSNLSWLECRAKLLEFVSHHNRSCVTDQQHRKEG